MSPIARYVRRQVLVYVGGIVFWNGVAWPAVWLAHRGHPVAAASLVVVAILAWLVVVLPRMTEWNRRFHEDVRERLERRARQAQAGATDGERRPP